MKNSGIEWIGEIPDSWELQPLRGHLTEVKESNDPIQTTQVLSLTNKLGVIPYEEKGEQGNKSKENYNEYKLAYPNTIVANSMNILIGSVGICNYFGCVSPVYYVFKSNNDEELKFLDYIFQSQPFQKELRRYAKGILEIRLRVSANDILRRQVAFPSLQQQKRIVDFLEGKLNQVDELIANQQGQIEKLKEYKQSVITEAVTKGLDKSAPMKDSGILWVNQIPITWRTIKMLHICDTITDYVASGSFADLAANVTYLDCPDYAMLVRTIDVSGKGYASHPVYIDRHAYEFLANSNVYGGELMFPNIGASVGDVYVIPKLYDKMSLAPNSIMVKCNANQRYIYYYFLSNVGRASLLDIAQSTAQPKFNKTDFRQLKIVLPLPEEQDLIVYLLDKKCKKIDRLIEIKQEKIEKLQEYKKSLIYEYVTGKKEVV